MRIKLLAFGKMGRGPEYTLFQEYISRLPWKVDVQEFEIKKPAATPDLRKKEEAEKLLAAIPDGSAVIVLDERGKDYSSRSLAEKIDSIHLQGFNQLTFIIGGADGLDETVRKKANLLLSLGKNTWPHMLLRVMLAEQIYRIWSIGAGHPYHRD
ncbi:23S rRNA (pseudouridine(1915)-N(3))-methyltransferase RlmH [Temperatibacter marinus]|uniref:Ribosomal RNA large subunit methyltransferase H n=1 Tax=Temperatibacter marinus TaxID=1456591 RepID=A0AA52EF82_9PROT|nr:23S rRNA (pseudouridine(1915)-N(3))-methyltransferase RlmH [Temperatibacter marinus]WND01444.1 23S rRNA (pseudouridine(1915)-N(3))-methyltransferase RlmH [Temperatibacter marinus]